MIKVENVTFDYKNGTRALDNISIDFPKGTISAVLGESGSGKTTLLNCIGQFLQPSQGKITFDDKDIYSIPETDYRNHVGIVFQKLNLFPHLNVMENLTLAMIHVHKHSHKQANQEAGDLLEKLNISQIAYSYPSQISGGQAQRVAIARGLLVKPDYMLLDEPTSALDINTTEDFASWLRGISDETNFIIVTHDILFSKMVAKSGVYLSEGKIAQSGTIEEITENLQTQN